MAITLATVSLPADLQWVDEFTWTPVEMNRTYTLTGALVVEQATRQAGRPITLVGGQDRGWVARSVVEALYALAQAPSEGLALELADGREFTVVFRHDETPLDAQPVTGCFPPLAADPYAVTLRLAAV